MSGELRIGTSGWNYPSAPGRWTGIVYPARQGARWRGQKFDELAWYAERFDTVEVNSTFYRVPSTDVTRAWAARTPPGFAFSVKLFQKLTHPAMFLDRVTRPPKGASPDEAVSFTGSHEDARRAAQPTADDVDAMRRALEPLAHAGKLGAVLAQFPPSFKAAGPAVEYLAWLLRQLADYQVAVELRHRSWSDALPATLQVLNASGAAWVQIDEPKFEGSIRQNFLPNLGGFYYLRLHGRNSRAWWTHEHSAQRYDYLYTMEELDPFVEVAEAVRTLVKKMYLYTNNHFEGKAVANAVMMKSRLGLPLEGGFPAAFGERYPHLRALSTVDVREHVPTTAKRSLF